MVQEPVVLVMTCDRYAHALQPFAYLFNRYWSDSTPVIVGGFTPPSFGLPSNFSFHSIGPQENYPVQRWSDGMIDILTQRPDLDFFVLMLEDYWLTRAVNTQAVRILWDYMHQFRYVLKMDLACDRLYAAGMSDYDAVGYLDLIKSDYNSAYHSSLYVGIWSRERMLEHLIPGETPWDFEINGTPRLAARRDEVLVLGTRQSPVKMALGYRGGNAEAVHYEGLKSHDVEAVRAILRV